MIKSKRKGFSLVEMMVIFTVLSFMLLAFIPLMLKRPQKTVESDCVGGLRSVRQEFHVENNAANNFTVPEEIASNLTVTLVGAGASGGDSSGEDITYVATFGYWDICNTPQWVDCRSIGLDRRKKIKCFVSYINQGNTPSQNACKQQYPDIVKAEDSSKYLPKFYVGGGSIRIDNRLLFLDSVPGEEDTYNNKLKLSGGMVPLNFEGFDRMTMGAGQGCKRDRISIRNNNFTSDGSRSKSYGIYHYTIPTAGLGGSSGAYAKFSMAQNSGTSCTITVGQGGMAGGSPQSGGDTSIQCGGGDIMTAGGGQGQSAGCNGGTVSIGGLPGTIINGTDCRQKDTDYIARSGADSYLGKGGREGCNCSKCLPTESEDLTICQDNNGANGMLGSGGGGGAYTETSQGLGGKGGDGLAVVEYLEYCK